ncbi:MAG: hypothetical protein HS117_16110 [Verrucomicrobiaceae bacterium]|jgi:hypothetical protein|nr:hypothetical protein [Verrucomicrobiaceae bacterium]
MNPPAFDKLLPALVQAGGELVLVGGAAGVAHDAARFAHAVDWGDARSREHYERLIRSLGDLDLLGKEAGGGTYESLMPLSVRGGAFGVTFRCMSLPKPIELKRAAGRPKDFEAIAELKVLLEG